MAWTEVVEQRALISKTYQDGTKLRLETGGTRLHYESVLDSEVFDAEVDLTPLRVNNALLDGWIVTQAGWHYALGQPGDKLTDGWVGFGGRKGAHWIKTRLTRVGYMHGPTRT